MNVFENNNVDDYSPEELRELYEEIDKSKKDTRNAYIAVGVIIILSVAVLFSNIFSSTLEPEGPSLTATLEQNTLLSELREQNSFLRSELTARQEDFRNERVNFETQINSKDQEISAFQNQVRELQDLLVNQANIIQTQEDSSSEISEDKILSLTQQVEERENESLSTDLNLLRDQVNQLLSNANDTSTEQVLEEVASLRSIVEESDPSNTADTSTEQILAEIARLRSTLEESDIAQGETQAPALTEKQIEFRDRFRTFVPILAELHKEVLQVELNTRNEIPAFTLDKLTAFKINTGWPLETQINREYRESLRDLWSLAEVLETVNVLSNDQGYLAPEVYLSDISSKITDLKNRPYETQLLLASITIFLDGVDTAPASRQPVTYPERALQRGISGQVNIEFAINRLGRVAEETINVLSGPRQLEESSIEALTQIEYVVSQVPDYIFSSVPLYILPRVRLFGFNQVFTFELEN